MKRFHEQRRSILTVIVLLVFSRAGLGQANQKMNVVLLVLDQLRADRLHCYGNPRATSPNLDRLAEQGVRFSHFYSVAPWTAPSYATLMTSLYPSRHGVTLFWRPGKPLIDQNTPVLAEIFKAHGYHTTAFVNNGVAGWEVTGRSFDEYFQTQGGSGAVNITQRRLILPDSTAPGTIQRVLPWLDQNYTKPFFLFVLFFEPHSPYDPPPEHDLFKSDAYPDQSDTGYDIKTGHLKRLAMLRDPKAVERLYQLYDGKIHFVDYYVGQLLDHLQKLGLTKNTLVVITSDHGELLYSHPRDYLTFDHRSLYDTAMHIPLVAAGPGVARGRVVAALASNLDTAPTILDLAGLPPLTDAQGRSLVPLIQGRRETLNPYVFGEEDTAIPQRSVRTERYKLIWNLWTGQKQLFDVFRDPQEQRDALPANPQVAKELETRLKEWMRENQPSRARQGARWETYAAIPKLEVEDDQAIGGRMLLTGGGWHSNESVQSGHWGGACFWTEADDGSRTAVWRGDNPFLGTYKVSVYFGHLSRGKLATDAPFTVVTEKESKTVRVNFNQGAGQWHLLGTFKDPRYVSVSNAADGIIIVDAVKFERVD
jgi:arylsulfatase A-like enzyme